MLEYKGLAIKTSGEVYEPAEDSFLASEMIERYVSNAGSSALRVMDMGTGTGILGLIAAKSSKVAYVAFVDIKNEAVKLAKENYHLNKKRIKAECKFFQSNLFGKVAGKYDLIIFNAPYLPDEKLQSHKNEWSGGATGIEASKRFINQAVRHLKEGGGIVLVGSSFANRASLAGHIRAVGLKVRETSQVHVFFEDIYAMLILR